MPQSGDLDNNSYRWNFSIGQQTNLEHASGNSRIHQGPSYAPPNTTNSQEGPGEGSGRGRVASSAPSTTNWRIGDIAMHEQKHNELAEQAVTYQVESRTQPEMKHYDHNQREKYNFKPGQLYRIWHQGNSEVHLSTFLILGIHGTNMNCLKLEYSHPDRVDRDFETTHVKLKTENHVSGTFIHPRRQRSGVSLREKYQEEEHLEDHCFVYMDSQQRLREDCWIDVLYPWNINWQSDYLFVRCGMLKEESFRKVVEIHLHLYNQNLEIRAT